MRWSSRWSWACRLLLATVGLAFAVGALSAQGPGTSGAPYDNKPLTEPHSMADLYGSLKDVINYGAELFNKQADHAGCYRVYQGALISIRPFMSPTMRKRIDESIVRAEGLPYYSERAFELRRTLDEIRTRAAPSRVSPPAVASPKVESPQLGVAARAPHVDLPKITETPRVEAPKVEVPAIQPPQITAPRAELPKIEKPKADPPKVDVPKIDPPKIDLPAVKPPEPEKKTIDPSKVELPSIELPKVVEKKTDAPKVDLPKVDPPKVDLPKIDLPPVKPVEPEKKKVDPPKVDLPKVDPPKIEIPMMDLPKDPLPIPVPPSKEIKDKKVEPAKAEVPADPLPLPPLAPKKIDAPTKERGEVFGTVLLDGKPLAQGFFITLVSADGTRLSTIVQKEGCFEFTKGLPLGTYRVAIEALPGDTAKAALIPMRYRDETTSGLAVQVTAGRVTPVLRLAK